MNDKLIYAVNTKCPNHTKLDEVWSEEDEDGNKEFLGLIASMDQETDGIAFDGRHPFSIFAYADYLRLQWIIVDYDISLENEFSWHMVNRKKKLKRACKEINSKYWGVWTRYIVECKPPKFKEDEYPSLEEKLAFRDRLESAGNKARADVEEHMLVAEVEGEPDNEYDSYMEYNTQENTVIDTLDSMEDNQLLEEAIHESKAYSYGAELYKELTWKNQRQGVVNAINRAREANNDYKVRMCLESTVVKYERRLEYLRERHNMPFDPVISSIYRDYWDRTNQSSKKLLEKIYLSLEGMPLEWFNKIAGNKRKYYNWFMLSSEKRTQLKLKHFGQ